MKGASWMDIRSDRQKGLSYVELGKKYHMDPRTAKRYAESPQKPELSPSRKNGQENARKSREENNFCVAGENGRVKGKRLRRATAPLTSPFSPAVW